jgi:hypothetical protein
MNSRGCTSLLAACAAAALALAACGPTTPQAPLTDAKKLDEATSGISTTCGLNYQLTAFPGKRQPDATVLEATAITAVDKLAGVYRRNPAWIYQGETIAKIVEDSLTMLRQCGLKDAAARLVSQTRQSG